MGYPCPNGRMENTNFYHIPEILLPVIYDIQFAIVDIPEKAHYETVAKNAGLSWKWFTDIDASKTWLRASKKEVTQIISAIHLSNSNPQHQDFSKSFVCV